MADQLTVERVTKSYGHGALALDDISFEVEPGTFLVLLGPSGSGKTTLLRCLAGIERVTAGSICLGGQVVAATDLHVPPEHRNLAMVFQDYALWPHLRTLDNVAFALRRHRHDRAAARRHAHRMLARVGLEHLVDRYPSELSGGEQQRVALARALVAGTGLLLCDEPLSNLDADLRERLRVEISELSREANATTVYITHDQAEAFALADSIGVLDQGRLVQLDVPEAIYHWPATRFVARFTGLACELDAVVRARKVDGLAEVVLTGSRRGRPIAARVAAERRVREHERGTLMVRPAGASLAVAGDERAHLVGRVVDVAFRGRGYEHVVELAGGSRVSGVLADRRHVRGDEVGVCFDPAASLFFPAGDDDDLPTPALTVTGSRRLR